jgi:very-short-patch-repair endonuclease
MTLAELILWKRLKDKSLFRCKFRRQHSINIFIVDFYCHEYRLAIEVDGEMHFEEEHIEYDLNRTAELNKFDIKVIRFTNYQIINDITSVISTIKNTITELIPL